MSGCNTPERTWATDDGETTTFTPLPYITVVPGGGHTSPPTTRPTTPSIFSRRLSVANSPEPKSPTASMFSGRHGPQSKANDKGKAPMHEQRLENSTSSNGSDTLAHHPFATYDRVRPTGISSSMATNTSPRRNRNSILGAASEALSFKFGRKQTRPAVRQVPVPTHTILPDVIEISAPPPDQEVEERNRLREMAAQAIGISPFIVHPDSYSQEETTEDEDDDILRTPADNSDLRRFGDTRNSESTPDIRNKSFLDTSSVSTTSHPARHRSGSVASHSRHNSMALTPIPSFPTNVLSLNPFLACSGYFPKYSQPSSLRRFALTSKTWKTRYILLSAPMNPATTPLGRNATPAVSYIHVFKSSSPDDKELERLEIHTDSAVFVADEEVGGRRKVIRIKGFEAVTGKTGSGVHEATWQIHIIDAAESQRWISAIKSAILGQRTLAAGLGIPTSTAAEPRGDLDVIMKIRSQGLANSSKPPPVTAAVLIHDSNPPRSPTDANYASSVSSQSARSEATTPKPAVPGPVFALKTLFTSRPRSTSRATSLSLDSERQHDEQDHADDSFTSMGGNLLGMLRPNPDSPTTPVPVVPFTPFAMSPERVADRRAQLERPADQWTSRTTPVAIEAKNRANRALSLGALSLQPPPRKRGASLRPTTVDLKDECGTGTSSMNSGSVAPGLQAPPDKAEPEPPSSPADSVTFSMTSYDERPRPSSLQTVDTNGSENTRSSNNSTKRSSSTNKRWSRQLPPRQTPPSGPPPVIPAGASLTQLAHSLSPEQPLSAASRVPSFSKRASTSSSQSVKSSSTKASATSTSSTRNSAHRISVPPPRPPPTSALPLAPDQEPLDTPPSASAKSFRHSMQRVRLSMIAPKPPPLSNLPLLPDEIESNAKAIERQHRHSTSSTRSHHGLDPIPEPSKLLHPSTAAGMAPFPPPTAPLPAPPTLNGLTTPTQQSTVPVVSRHSSLKQRLRMLSAPSPSPTFLNMDLPPPMPSPSPNSRPTTMATSTTPTGTPTMPYTSTYSTPSTPIDERTTYSITPSGSSSFLHMSNNTPTPPGFVPSRIYDHTESTIARSSERRSQELAELLDDVAPLSLSPPPRNRRGSQQIVPTIQLPVEQEVSTQSTGSTATVSTWTPPTKTVGTTQAPSILSGFGYDDQDHDDYHDHEDDDLVLDDDEDFLEDGMARGEDLDDEVVVLGDVMDGICQGRHISSSLVPPKESSTHSRVQQPNGSVVTLGHASQ